MGQEQQITTKVGNTRGWGKGRWGRARAGVGKGNGEKAQGRHNVGRRRSSVCNRGQAPGQGRRRSWQCQAHTSPIPSIHPWEAGRGIKRSRQTCLSQRVIEAQ